MMKGNKISFFLLLFTLPSFSGVAKHQDDFLSDILKLDVSDSDVRLPSPPSVQKKQHEKAEKKADITDKKQKSTELSELTAQIATLRQQNAKLQESQKGSADALTKKGTELSELTAQIATLRQQNAKLQESQKGSADALAKKGTELSELTTQIATLRQQNAKLQESQKGSADALAKKSTELSELTAQIATLRQQNDKPLDKKKPGEILSYSLGTYYLQKVMMDLKELEINGIQISQKKLTQGFNDASNKKQKLSEKEIRDALSSVNRTVQRNAKKTEALLREKIGNKQYRKIQPGVYLVVNEKGKGKYAETDVVNFNMFEKKLDGTPVKNTINGSVLYKKTDPLMKKLVNAGLKGGRVTIYGKALYIYKVLPKDVTGDEIVSITFVFK
ncbi:FKBP-type peptidyl-prolyl cis-trans isomerase N-terminal domain-containing protein [Escherichia coli]|uniref:FKBP-type peptidyl-prolyl cis-trans isomerase N-terminal domain-containing protein n=1 Tax=Escherichia coli TaxID=562 RepID=UPI0039C9C87A